MNGDDQNKIDELNKSLYSRNAPDIRTKRRLRFHEQEVNVNTDWEHKSEPFDPDSIQDPRKKGMSFFTKILFFSVIFFLIASGIGAYLYFNGANVVSPDNVDITINGPLSVSGGEQVSFEVQIANENNIELQNVDMSVDFPSGTVDPTDSLKELKNYREVIPNIIPGGIGQKTIKAVLYGEENSKRTIKVSIEYKVTGSNATFQKEKTFDLLISSAPLNLSVSSFKEVNSGQEFEMAIMMNSNSKETIKNLLLKAVYPFGYTYISSDLKPNADNSTWKIGDIPPGGKRVIKIKGKLDGQDDEMRVFRFSSGAARLGNDSSIGTEYITGTQEISIKKPFMTVGINLNSDSGNKEFVTAFNNSINVDLTYFNNLPNAITDGEVRLKISGTAFDKASVSPGDGLYNSANSEIVWNGITTNDLRNIEAGGSGRVSFSIIPRNLSSSQKGITSPNIKFDVSVNGRRNSESNVPENIVSTTKREIRVSSNVTLGGQILRSTGPFANTGFIPPKSEQETTYTVVWTVDNTANTASDAVVRSSLPPYVKWLDKISPAGEDITYDRTTGQLVWNVGNLNTYTAGTSKRRQVAFQISLVPNVSQVGTPLTLVNPSSVNAEDDFTGEVLKSNLGQLTTRFSTDPSYKDGDDVVGR